jgi:hypothetical protein
MCGLRLNFVSVVCIAASLLVTGSQAAVKASPSKAAELKTYLTKIQTPAVQISRGFEVSKVVVGLYRIDPTDQSNATSFRGLKRLADLHGAHAAKVKAPSSLRGPHTSLVRAAKSFSRTASILARKIENGAAPEPALIIYNSDLAGAKTDLRHWRTETTIQLRRLGLVVPLWLKKIGK